ncbi:MAG: 4-aminobutyrate aminotransferase [Firmicutes bacterium]|nr:4-aminobutyrate aminotransferase [Bacillota bacterium]
MQDNNVNARSGKVFAIENWGVEPDIMTTAKSIAAGIPLSAVTGKAAIMDAPGAGNVGGTYGGNPLACVAGIEILNILKNRNYRQTKEPNNELTVQVIKLCLAQGLLFTSARSFGNVIRLLILLIVTDGQLDQELSISEQSLLTAMAKN